MKKKMQKGFSLVELMVVIAIIAILAAVAVPMYSNYTTRAKLGTALTQLGAAKAQIAEDFSNATAPSGATTDLPAGVTFIGTPTNTSATLDLAFTDNTLASGGTSMLRLVGTAANGVTTWECQRSSANAEANIVPSSCANTTY